MHLSSETIISASKTKNKREKLLLLLVVLPNQTIILNVVSLA
jgi:hypothetical protein